MKMPTSAELRAVFGHQGATGYTTNAHRRLIDAEASDRRMRDNQTQDNCVFVALITATFGGDGGSTSAGQWVDFGRLRFTKTPGISGDTIRHSLAGEPALLADFSNFDPVVHFTMPCVPIVIGWGSTKGMISRAFVAACALGAVPEGFMATVTCKFTGPAVRLG